MLKTKIKTFSVLALVSVLAISLSLFGLSLDKPRDFVFADEVGTSSSEESTTEKPTEETAVVAKIGEKTYSSLSAAVAAANAGDTITLVANTEENVVVDKDLTIDLGDYTLASGSNDIVLTVESGDVVINAENGGIRGGSGSNNVAIMVTEGNLTVNGGNYYVGGDKNGLGNSTVYIAGKGTVTINGGMFETEKPYNGLYYVLNIYNKAKGAFVVNGGTFINCNPADGDDNLGGNFVPDGYKSVDNGDGSYTVKKLVAKINDVEYTSLSEAVAAAKDGETVVLISNIDLDEQIAIGKAITIDGQGKFTVKATKKLFSTNGKPGMFYRTQGAQGTLTFKDVTLDGNGVSKIFLNEGGAGETVFDGVTSKNGGGIAYGSGIHISGGGSHATIKNSTLTGSTGTMKLSEANYYAANDLWVGGNVYVTVENSTIGYVFVNSAPTATTTNGVVHGQLTITGENTKITYLSGEEEAADKLDKFGNNGSLVKIENGLVETIFDKGSFSISGGTFKTELEQEWLAEGLAPVKNDDGTYGVAETVAEIGENSYASLSEAIAAANAGETVTLVADTAENVTINKDLTLDLGDYTLSSGDKDVVLTVEKGNVIINAGKGGVRGGSGSDNIAIEVIDGNLTINGGSYYVGGDKNGLGNSTVYIAGSGKVTINGGWFETEKSWNKFYYVLNIQNNKTGTFIVNGGTFINYNPAKGDDNLGGNFVAEGCGVYIKSLPSGVVRYEVFKGNFKVTEAGGTHVGYYDTLEDAIAAAPSGGHIYLANNYTLSANVYDLSNIVLDLNSYTLTCSAETFFVGKNAKITWGKVIGETGAYALNIGKENYNTDNFEIFVGDFYGIKIQNATNVTLDGCDIEGTDGYAVLLCENSTATFTDYNLNIISGKNGMFACEKGSVLTIESYKGRWGFKDGKFFVNLGGELMVSSAAKEFLETEFTSLVANYVFVETETEGYYSVIEKSTLKEYLVNLGTSITLKVSVNEVGKNVKVTYAYGDDEVEIAKHTDGFYYIENITPQIIDRVYTVKVYEGGTVVDSKELSVLGYCDTLLGTTTASEEAKAAVKALVYYGKAAKEFLGMTDTTAIEEVITNHNLTETKLAKPTNSATSTGENLISKVTLNVSDVNAIVYAMTAENYKTVYGENSGYTVTIGGKEIKGSEWVASGDLYVYTGADIYASELGNQVEVVIKNGETEVQRLVYGVYDYCANKWEADGVSGIAKAIYAYGFACKNYADSIKVTK